MKRIPHFHEKRGQSKNGKQWVAYYHAAKIDGKVKWTSLGTNRVEALRKWAELEKCPAPAESGTFDAISGMYINWLEAEVKAGRNSKRTFQDRQQYLKSQLIPVFGGKPFEAISSLTVRTYLDKRTAKISAKKEMRFLSVLWNWAKERGHVKLANPVAGVRMPKESGRAIEVRPEAFWLVWECGDQMVKDVLELAARLGTRPQEVFDLQWKDISLSSQPAIVRVWQSKVDEWRTVEADDDLRALLERLRGTREQPQGYLLTDAKGAQLRTTGAFRFRFDKARKLAEIEAKKRGVEIQRFQHRDIRPMAGISSLQSEGMDAARRLLGHTTEKMTAHYTTKRTGTVGKSAPVRSTSNFSGNITK